MTDFERRGSDPLLPPPHKEEEKESKDLKAFVQNIQENYSKQNFIPNKEQEKTLIKNNLPLTTPDKTNIQKTVLNPKLQALFARSNSPKENQTNPAQTNTIQNTNALPNKLNLPGNINMMKFGNTKEENNFMNKGSPKNINPTSKLQDQIKQLQQEQMLLQKKIPQIYQNTEPKNNTNNKLPMNYNLTNKFSNNKDKDNEGMVGAVINKNNFGDVSGSPKNQNITPNSKQNYLISDTNKNMKNLNLNLGGFQNNNDKNVFRGKQNDGVGLGQSQNPNLYQNFLNQKAKK